MHLTIWVPGITVNYDSQICGQQQELYHKKEDK